MIVKAGRNAKEEDTASGGRLAGSPPRVPTRLMPALVFFSGMAALVFQVAWFREFRLVFGSSTAASAAVTAIFMGGLGLGSAVLGPWADRVANPLKFYAVLEAAVALTAAASPWLVDGMSTAYIALGGQTTLGIGGATVVRLVFAALVLALPTGAMGGTLPAAVRAVTTPGDRQRRRAAVLYGVNTLGAVAGALLSTFVLLPSAGARTTLWLAALVNLGVGAAAWAISRRAVRVARDASGRAAGQQKRDRPSSLLLVYLAAGIVGFAFFLMELVWYRMLGPILGGTTYTFGLILAVALLGIGLGGAAYAILVRRFSPSLSAFAATCSLEAACIAAPFAAGDRLALLAARYGEAAGGFGGHVFGWAVVAVLVVLPAALVSGVQFPLLLALAGRGDRNVGRQVGLTLTSNTLGAILGSLAGGFGLLPLLTAPGAWIVVVVLLVALGLAALLAATRRGSLGRAWIVPVGAAVVALVCLRADGPTAVWRHSGIGAGRVALPQGGPNAIQDWVNAKRRQVLWQAEGVEASVALVAIDGLSFYVNGKSDGNATGDAGTQIMLGVLPALLHPEPKAAMVVGLGTGETPGWLAEVPGIEQVDVVELEPAVDEMARCCAPVNHHVLDHPKVRRIYNDAREVLLTAPDCYDIIASEPSNPYRAGIANLFTREFYLAARARLRAQGLFVQWVQGYEIDEATVRTALATLRSVFDHVEVWQSKPEDMLLVCSCRPLRYSPATLRRRIAEEPFRSAFAFGWRAADLEGMLSRFVAGPALVDRIAADEVGFVNTDDRNRIEYGFARTVGKTGTFSIEGLRKTAAPLAAHRPDLAEDHGIDWDRVEGHRQLLDALVGGVSLPSESAPEHRARAEVLSRYWAADMKGMTQEFEHAGYEPLVPVEIALLALGYADQGSDKARELTARLRSFQPIEADAIEAYLVRKRGDSRESADLLERVFVRLRSSPWGLSHAVELCFSTAVAVAEADPAQAPRLYAALREPFAVYAYEETRLSAALAVARSVGPQALLEAVLAYEPHVPWTKDFLTLRLRIYEASRHPLGGRAREDLEAFRRQEAEAR